jgi:hypothetical protein
MGDFIDRRIPSKRIVLARLGAILGKIRLQGSLSLKQQLVPNEHLFDI